MSERTGPTRRALLGTAAAATSGLLARGAPEMPVTAVPEANPADLGIDP